jgi:UDP-N-acetyl-D-glucosamine dehydrogenase
VAYKPNVGDVRESPALDVILLLQARGAQVIYHDPYVADLTHEGISLQSITLSEPALSQADCVVIITNHAAYDWEFVANQATLIVDTRHAIKQRGRARVVSF